MSEPQYKHYHQIPRTSLGLMSNQLWQDDPKMLGIHLARYKFVAKMLTGKKKVAEIGCGDGFYSRIVQKEVGELHLYDFDHAFINDMNNRGMANIKWHDILQQPIPKIYQAVYSLDVLEHFTWEEQKIFLSNACHSLENNGVFIVGMPSLESQIYASPTSILGHVGCLSGDELKELLEKYFYNVFLLSMNDETIHSGFYPMAHYLIAVCTNVR